MGWEEVGGGTPVVLVHGIPTPRRLWRHVGSPGSRARGHWPATWRGTASPSLPGADATCRRPGRPSTRTRGSTRSACSARRSPVTTGAALCSSPRSRARSPAQACSSQRRRLRLLADRQREGSARRGRRRAAPPRPVDRDGPVPRAHMARGHHDARVAAKSLAVHRPPSAAPGADEALVRRVRAPWRAHARPIARAFVKHVEERPGAPTAGARACAPASAWRR